MLPPIGSPYNVAIYMLICDFGGDASYPLYVGRTRRPFKRWRRHMGPDCHSAALKEEIARLLTEWDPPPAIRLVEVEWTRQGVARDREEAWLRSALAAGWSVKNRLVAS